MWKPTNAKYMLVRGLQASGITMSSFRWGQWKVNIPQAIQPVMTFQDL